MARFVKNTKVFTVFDSTINIDEEEIKDFCEANEIDIPAYGSNEYWRIYSNLRNWDWEDFWDNIKYSKLNNEYLIITGDLGLWNGRPDIVPVKVWGIKEALDKIISMDIEDIKVVYNCGMIEVYAYHHDGTNYFQIHRLSKAGEMEIERPKYEWYDLEPKDWWFKQIKEEELF